MLETTPAARTPLAGAALSVVLLAGDAPVADEDTARAAWQLYLDGLGRPYELLVAHPGTTVILAPGLRHDAGVTRASPSLTPDLRPPPSGARKDDPVPIGPPADGLGGAIRRAVEAARYPLVALCPCDGQFRPADLATLLGRVDAADVVVGVRSAGPVPAWRRFLDRLASLGARVLLGTWLEPRPTWVGAAGWGRRWVARWVFGLRLTDPECPLQLWRREALLRIPLQSRGLFVFVEMLAKANHLEFLLAEVPVAWSPPGVPGAPSPPFGVDARRVFRDPDFGPPPDAAPAAGPARPAGDAVPAGGGQIADDPRRTTG